MDAFEKVESPCGSHFQQVNPGFGERTSGGNGSPISAMRILSRIAMHLNRNYAATLTASVQE